MTQGEIQYVINTDRILLAGSQSSWHGFARENQGSDLIPFPEGWDLLDCIADHRMRQLHAELIGNLVRWPQRPVSLPFRADSPDVIRPAVLNATPIACSVGVMGVFFQSRILSERARRRRAVCLSRTRPTGIHWPSAEYCSTCGHIRAPHLDNGWGSFDEYYGEGGVDEVRIVQSVCPPCMRDFRDRINP